jgi:glycosyltransferase involved in cell wall biosynthesis
MKLSVIIPGYKEPYIQRTIDSFLASSELGDDLEIIAVLDNPHMAGSVRPNSRVKIIQFNENRGMRAAINAGLELATGDFVMKTDAHCAYAEGFDRIMIENCKDDWLLIPREYSLDENTWGIIKNRPFRDYHYLCFPTWSDSYGLTMTPQVWRRKNYNFEYLMDDTMIFQGSCWLAKRILVEGEECKSK